MLTGISQYANIFQLTEPLSRRESDSTVATQKSTEPESATDHPTQIFSSQDKTNPDGSQKDAVELSQEADEIRTLQLRDREVRAHEAAHAAAGGAYAGSPTYSFERGPNGRTYATGGAVSIDISPISGDPQATLQKAQQVRAAALAPAEPSAQDIKVAQKAQTMAAKARIDISQQMSEGLKSPEPDSEHKTDSKADYNITASTDSSATQSTASISGNFAGIARLSIYS